MNSRKIDSQRLGKLHQFLELGISPTRKLSFLYNNVY